jgi:hypothetical protein
MTAQQANWDESLLPQQPWKEHKAKSSKHTDPARPAAQPTCASRCAHLHTPRSPARQPEHLRNKLPKLYTIAPCCHTHLRLHQ